MMRGTAATGWGLLIAGLVGGVLIAIGLYVWDSGARTAEAALRPPPVAPLAVATRTPGGPLVGGSPIATQANPSDGLPAGDPDSGQTAFAAQCSSCHPGANAGIGPAVYGPQFAERYPEDGPFEAVIRQGKGGMPAFSAGQLADPDLANIIAYLRGLSSGAISPEPTPTPRPRQRGG